ncbi:MAG: hypothetical protein KBD31_03120 [Proteobacteria bacterium]|nr:hypothetical protein [Pseudomonadota bacterium]
MSYKFLSTAMLLQILCFNESFSVTPLKEMPKLSKETVEDPPIQTSKYFTADERIVRLLYPATYKSASTLDSLDVKALTSPLTEVNVRKKIELQQLYMLQLEEYCEQIPESPTKTVILSNLHHLKQLGVDGYLGDEHHENALLLLRALAAAEVGSLSASERDLFEPFPGSKAIFAMYRKVPLGLPSHLKTADGKDVDPLFAGEHRFAWQHSNKAIRYYFMESDTPGKNNVSLFPSYVSKKVNDILEAKFSEIFGEPEYWPMIGADKVGISTLVKTLLDGVHILPLPYPSSKLIAHGTKLSPIALTFHDYLHSLQDKRWEHAKIWISDKIKDEIYKKQNIHYNEIVDQVVMDGKRRYDKVMSIFKEIFQKATVNFIDDGNKKRYNQKIIPIYLFFHEAYVFDQNWLNDDHYNNPNLIIHEAVSNAKEHFKKTFSKENPYEEIWNRSVDKDEAAKIIIDDILKKNVLPDDMNYLRDHKFNPDDILKEECSVRQNSMYTVVTIVQKDGLEFIYYFPIRANIERDLKDFYPLLKISGFSSESDDETRDHFDQREIFIQRINDLFDNFERDNFDVEKSNNPRLIEQHKNLQKMQKESAKLEQKMQKESAKLEQEMQEKLANLEDRLKNISSKPSDQ